MKALSDQLVCRWRAIRYAMVGAFAVTEALFILLALQAMPLAAQSGVFSFENAAVAAEGETARVTAAHSLLPRVIVPDRTFALSGKTSEVLRLLTSEVKEESANVLPEGPATQPSRAPSERLTLPTASSASSVSPEPPSRPIPAEPSPVNPLTLSKLDLAASSVAVSAAERFFTPLNQSDNDPSPEKSASPSNRSEPIRLAPSGWTTITTQGFEGAFPPSGGKWRAFDKDGTTNGELYWDDTYAKSHTGTWSAWPADEGANRRNANAGDRYADKMQSWLTYGPFDLSDADDAQLDFWYWNKSESGWDYFKWYASGDGTNFSGYQISGDQSSWRNETLSLASYAGDSSVWIAFVFTSDGSNTDVGPFIDDIEISKHLKPTTGTLTVTLRNVPDGWVDAPGNTGWIELFKSDGTPAGSKSTTRTGDREGQATFINLTPGQYVFNGYQDGPQGREDWGVSSQFTVSPGSNSQSMTRHRPYVTDVVLKRDSGGAVIGAGERLDPGTVVRAELTIKNPATYQVWNVTGQLRLDRTGDGTADQTATTESRMLAAGESQTFTARATVSELGDYRRAVTARYSNLSILSDGWAWANAFTVAWPPNASPTLTNGSVSPMTGPRAQQFHYEVTYTDADSNWPATMQVVIPTVGTFDMTKKYDWDIWVTDGVDYVYERFLPLGSYTATFTANDGKNNHADVTYGITGPTVYNQAPSKPTGPSPADGATDVPPSNLTLDWANATDPDGDTVSYQVRYREVGGSFSDWIDVSSSSYAIPNPLVEEKRYEWQVRSVDSLGLSTDGDIWSFATKRIHGTVTLSICNVSWSTAADVPGNQGIVRLYRGSTLVGSATTTKTSARCGTAKVDPVPPTSDGYVVRIYFPGPFEEEFWGATGSITVGEGQDVIAPEFTRRRPVAKDVAFYRDAAHTQSISPSDTVEVGATVYASVLVENLMSVMANPTVNLRLDIDKTAPFDVDLSQTILSIPAGQLGTASFSFTVDESGIAARSILVTTQGDLTDSWAWGDAYVGGSRPVITNANPTASTVTVQKGEQQLFSINYRDADNDVSSIAWILDGTAQSATGTTFDYTAPSTAGTHTLTVRVTDALNLSAERTWTIVVPANKPPSLSIAITDVDNRTKKISFTTSDYENQSTTVSIFVDDHWKTGIPNVPPTSPFSSSWDWVASSDEVLAGDHVIRVEVTDGENATTESQTVRFTPEYSVSLVDLRQQWVALRHDSVYQSAYGQVRAVPGSPTPSGFEGATTIIVRNVGNTRVTYELTPGQQTLFARGDAYQGETPLAVPWSIGVAPYSWGPQYSSQATVTIEPHAEGSFLLRPSVPASEELDETVVVQFTLKSTDALHPEDRLASTQSDVVYRTVDLPTYNDANLANFFTSLQQLGTSAWNFFVGDDWAMLNDDEATVFERAFAAGMLVSNVALVGDAKVAVKGAFAGGRKITGEVTATKLAPLLEDAAKGTAKGALARTELRAAIRADVKTILGVSDGKAWIRALTDSELDLIGKRLMDGSFGLDTSRFERFVRAINGLKEAKNYRTFVQKAISSATVPSQMDTAVFAAEQAKGIADDVIKQGYSVSERVTLEQSIQVGNRPAKELDVFVELGDATNPRYILYEIKKISVTSVETISADDLDQLRYFLTAIKEGSPGLGKVLTPNNARLEFIVREFTPTNPSTFNRELTVALGGAKASVTRQSGGIAAIGLSPFAAAIITTNGGETVKTASELVQLDGTCPDPSTNVEVNGSITNVTFNEAAQSWHYETTESKGPHTYEVRCVDVSGSLSEAGSIDVLVDPPPVITTNSGQDFATNQPTLTLEGTAETFFTRVLVNDSDTFVTYNQSTGQWRYTNTFGYEGTHTFNVTAKTASGVSSDPATIRITYETTASTVSVTPRGGSFSDPVTVTLTASEPADIHYTTDGTLPTTDSPTYATPLTFNRTTTLKFMAVDAAGNQSSMGEETYTITTPEKPVVRTIEVETRDSVRGFWGYVRLGGRKQAYETIIRRELGIPDTVIAEPETTSWSYTARVLLNPKEIVIGQPNVERLLSRVGTTESAETVVRFAPTSQFTLTATPAGGRFDNPIAVTLVADHTLPTTVTVDGTEATPITFHPTIDVIDYTTDGSPPTTSSSRYSQPIPIVRTTTLKAIAASSVGLQSEVLTEQYVIAPAVAASPSGGTFIDSVTVTLTADPAEAVITYWIEGERSVAPRRYTEPLTFRETTTLHAYAELDGVRGNQITERYRVQTKHVLPANQWTPLAVPGRTAVADLGPGVSVRRWHPESRTYEPVIGELVPWEGYWIKSTTGQPVQLPVERFDELKVMATLETRPGYVLIPSFWLDHLGELRVNALNESLSLTDAITTRHWLGQTAYRYDTTTQATVPIDLLGQLDQSSILGRSIWVRAYQPVTLNFTGQTQPGPLRSYISSDDLPPPPSD